MRRCQKFAKKRTNTMKNNKQQEHKNIRLENTEKEENGRAKAGKTRAKHLFYFGDFDRVKRGLEAALNKVGTAGVSTEACNVDIPTALRICEERRVTVEGPERSYVSFDRVDDPWAW